MADAGVVESFVVELGLDTKGLQSGARDADKVLDQTKDKTKKTADDVDKRTKDATEFAAKLRNQLILLYSVFTGFRGIESFVANITDADTALARLSYRLDTSVADLSAWAGAGAQIGVPAGDIYSSFQNLTTEIQKFAVTGQSAIVPWFRAMGISLVDSKGKARDLNDVFMDMAKWGQGKDPRRAAFFFEQVGVAPGMVNLLLQGPDKLKKELETSREFAPTDKDIKAAAALTESWSELKQASNKLAVTMMTLLTPALLGVINALVAWDKFLIGGGAKAIPGLAQAAGHSAATAVKGTPAYVKAKAALSKGNVDPSLWIDALYEAAETFLSGKSSDGAGGARPTSSAKTLLDSIAKTEGRSYNALYGGGTFSGYADHPNKPVLIRSGPNAGKYSTAAGRYQLLYSTWLDAKRALGLKDFSPASQDAAAWWVAQRDYRAHTGRDLLKDLQSHDPRVLARIGAALAGTWTSLPGGIEATQSGAKFLASISGIGAKTAAASHVTTHHHVRTLTIGSVTFTTAATDAEGIARDFNAALERQAFASSADSGPQ